MKYAITFCMALLFATAIFSQEKVGIFKTFKDFQNGKLEAYEEYEGTMHIMGNFKVTFRDKTGKKQKFDVDAKRMWGYVGTDNRIFRVDQKDRPCVIIAAGEIFAYGNYSTQLGEETASMTANQFPPQISKGPNGEMVTMTKKHLLELVPKASPLYEDAKNCRNNMNELVDFINLYNHEMQKAKEKDTSSKN
ncbi:MAG: hypothetical protein IT258_06790 [Saprospiraceae bacterium]|nr:hypothetical protein [Saprospiraceae bacterium]